MLVIPFAERVRMAIKALSPIGYWPLIDDAYNIAPGREAKNTISGATINQPGLVDNAISFDGTDDYIDLGALSELGDAFRDSTPITVSFLLATTVSTNKWIFGRSDSGNTDFLGLMINRNDGDTGTVQNKLRGFFRTTDNAFHNWGITSAYTNLTDGNFKLITFVISPGDQNYKIYINGVNQTVTVNNYGSGNLSNFTTNGNFYLGGINSNGSLASPLNCKIQHCFVLDRAITQAEVTSLAQLMGLA